MSMRKLSFKWFGSLTNLSFRRSSDKSDSKSSKLKSEGLPGDDSDSATVSTKILAPVAETTVDDLGAMRPRTASYVRSSESYTHMGTLPRLLRMKRDKSNKGGPSNSKKSKDKSNISRSQSQRPVRDKDHAPPRIKAASFKEAGDEAAGKADTRPDQHSLTDPKTQLKPTDEVDVKTTQNITSEPEGVCEDVSPSGGSNATIQPETCKEQEITQAAADLNPEETHMEPAESQADYVQFSKEKYLLESPPEKLRKELEEELKLSPADIRSHGWYHGHIPRE
ncbi:SH2 domain-containing protein 3C-like isoform X1, partial [Lates japonicus]